ncbi:TonB-dependent receptor [Qipengyuania sp.]|uniref:TonB-dependent receptor n=1 Tax=Qipengyuania sp. TaxID=2004515 RepID=UPI003AF4E5C1
MKFKYLLAASVVSTASAMVAAPAAAQSTGSVDFEEGNVIIVSGARASDVGGVDLPDSPKAKQVLTEEIIRAQRPGQTVNDIVNLVPGVNFQNNDPWGSSGGSFTIRGFSSDRISQTVDGVPLNDSGNYALYTNQQQDPETLASVNVNLGSTDVDSPTASASGGTINIRTREPSDEAGITATMTFGDVFASGNSATDRDRIYMRGFAMLDTGDLTGMGTKAFVSASFTRYNNPFNNYGTNEKQQYNARIWQDIGDNGDFIAIAGHYNQNRNNFFGSFRLPDFPTTKADRFYSINWPCTVDQAQAGVADTPNSCGTEFDRRFNPSNTGNIRGTSRFTLTDGLTLTVEPSYQYVKANGGGTTTGYEYSRSVGGEPFFGYISGRPYAGVDLNGDGDLLDQVTVLAPSQTRTHRFAVISNIAYEINEDHSVRLAYTWERANHRQTGQVGLLDNLGEPFDVFPVNDGIVDVNGNVLQKRDRQSYATLNQISGQYLGHFGGLTVDIGVRAPFFKRDLDQRCFTTSSNGFVDCVYGADVARYAAANPTAAAPQERTYKYDKLLPNVGFTYDFGDASLFTNYSKGLQVPGTDNLYNSIYFPLSETSVQPVPETTDSFDLGGRLRTGTVQMQLTGWYTRYNNRLASAYDPVTERSIYRNLGRVDKYGIDGSVSWQPTPNIVFYVFGSLLKSEIKDDVQAGVDGAGNPTFFVTGGKRESGAPTHSFGARAQYTTDAFQFGIQAKRTGKRYINDENLELASYGSATVSGYTLVDLDARWNIGETPWGNQAAIQLNITNLFDELYVGGFGGSLDAGSSPFVQIGAPRAASLSFILGY